MKLEQPTQVIIDQVVPIEQSPYAIRGQVGVSKQKKSQSQRRLIQVT